MPKAARPLPMVKKMRILASAEIETSTIAISKNVVPISSVSYDLRITFDSCSLSLAVFQDVPRRKT